MTRRALAGSLLASLTLTACKAPHRQLANRAFYYWRTTLTLSSTEQKALMELHISKLYLRLFDVAVSSRTSGATGVNAEMTDPQLIGRLQTKGITLPIELEVVPVVFLRNQVFAESSPSETAALASHVWEQAMKSWKTLAAPGAPPRTLREVQFDCDWTDSTRERFFQFLAHIRSTAPPSVALSATIRLHQVKFRERTGVPPVQRGMLMFYNMGHFSGSGKERSIFDSKRAKPYLKRLENYPLELDVALPLWSWTLQLRGTEVVGLLQNTDPAELPQLDFLRVVRSSPQDGASTSSTYSAPRFEVLRTTFLHGSLLRRGDILKGEALTNSELQAAAQLLAQYLDQRHPGPRTVAFFDLSERNLHRHTPKTLENAFQIVH